MNFPSGAAAENSQPQHKQLLVDEPIQDEEKLELLEYWRSIVKRKKEILALGTIVALLAAAIVFVLTPIYRATATVMVEASKSKVVSIEDVYSGMSQNKEYFQTQVEILKSREVAIKAIIATKLWDYPEFDPRTKEEGLLAGIKSSLGIGEPPPEWNDQTLADAIYENFDKKLSVQPIRLSQLINISFDSESPQLSAKVANAMAKAYIENDLDTRYEMTQQATNWLQERLGGLRGKLADAERALQEYREKQGIVDIKDVAQAGAGMEIEAIQSRLIDARIARTQAENTYRQIKNTKKGQDLTTNPLVLRNPLVADALRQMSDAQRTLNDLSQRYGTEHPKYISAAQMLQSAKDNLQDKVAMVVDSITREYEAAVAAEQALSSTLAQSKGSVQNINRKEFELNVLEREVESNREIYDTFLKRAKETSASTDIQSPVARIVDPATPPERPAKPKKMQIIAIALFLGLFLGALVALLIDRLDNTLKTSEDVELRLRQPLLTTLPLIDEKELEGLSMARLFDEKPDSIYSEAIRTARTSVLLSAIDQPNRILLVTSSVPGEGKTTFAVNIAQAHAHTKKTLLIDADMRRPMVARSLDLVGGGKGLSNLVAGTSTLAECLQSLPGSPLSVMGSGTVPPNPLELLLSDRFKKTLEDLSKEFEIIVIDSPPIELVSDAMVIASLSTSAIYVVKAMETPFQLVRKGLLKLKRADAPILGVVLNRLDFEKADRYYGEYSGYSKHGGYGYKSTYGSLGTTYGATASQDS
jgi:polysaccharide biosynthesis transport protein